MWAMVQTSMEKFISMFEWVPNVSLHFSNKNTRIDLFVAKTTCSVLGMDAIYAFSRQLASVECQLPEPEFPSKNTATLTLRPDVLIMLQQKSRRLPMASVKPVGDEIQRLLAQGVIKVIDSLPYISPIVIVHKKDSSAI